MGGEYDVGSGSILGIAAFDLGDADIGVGGVFGGTLALDGAPLAPALSSVEPQTFVARYSSTGTAMSAIAVGPAVSGDGFPYDSDAAVRAATALRGIFPSWASSPERRGVCVAGALRAGQSVDPIRFDTSELAGAGGQDSVVLCLPKPAVLGCEPAAP